MKTKISMTAIVAIAFVVGCASIATARQPTGPCDLLKPAEISKVFHEPFDVKHIGRNPSSCNYDVTGHSPGTRYVETVLLRGREAKDAFAAAKRSKDARRVHSLKSAAVYLARSDAIWVRETDATFYVAAFLLDIGAPRSPAQRRLTELARIALRRV